MAYRTVNPYTNEVVATFDELTNPEAMNLLARAEKSFESWSHASCAERAAVCNRSAAILTEKSDEFAHLLTCRSTHPSNQMVSRAAQEGT